MSNRKLFSSLLESEMEVNKNIILLTADLGYGLWDTIREKYPDRFYNVMASEQLMIGMAVGLSLEGKIPFCYSITPFLLYRPFEFIRNYLEIEQMPVKLIAGGRNNDYGTLGYTHCAPEDKKILNSFNNIKGFWPNTENELKENFKYSIEARVPIYINLRK